LSNASELLVIGGGNPGHGYFVKPHDVKTLEAF
jgi:hypothetical protein